MEAKLGKIQFSSWFYHLTPAQTNIKVAAEEAGVHPIRAVPHFIIRWQMIHFDDPNVLSRL